MESSSRNVTQADDLDSTVLRHQVRRYFNELDQESLGDSPLNMDFLSMKRKPASGAASTSLRTSHLDSFLPKKMRFDSSATGENSFAGDLSLFPKRAESFSQSLSKQHKVDVASQYEQKMSEKEAKIIELQKKIIQIEMKFNDSITANNQLEHDLENVKDACNSKVKHYEDQIEDLQIEMKHLQQKFEQLSRDNQLKRETMDQLKLVCAGEKMSYIKELTGSEQKLIDIQLEYEAKIKKLEESLENSLWETRKSQLEAEEAKNQLKIKEKISSPCNHQVVIEQQRQVILEMENALFTQRATFSQSQEAKLARIPQLEKELVQLQQTNKLFQETAAKEILLKSEIMALQESVQRYKEQCQAIPNLERELKNVTAHLHEWDYMARSLFEANSISEVQTKVEEMRSKEQELVCDLGTLQTELNSLNKKNLVLLDKIESLMGVSKTKSELEDRVRKLTRKLIVVQKDRDHYRTMSDQYENDMTRVGGSALVSTENRKIAELESLLEEYRGLAEVGNESPSVSNETILKITQEKEGLTKEVAELSQTIKVLKLQLETAESKGMSSDTRVLHFTNNPLDNVRRKTLEKLAQVEKENESLRERVRLMEAGVSQNITLMVGEHFEQGCTPERLKELEEKLKSSELKNQRVEEVFRKYCSDFRRGIFELFGYQVDNDECGNYKLTSVFSESSDDYLSFKYVGDGLMVMDSPYVHTIDDLVQLHITNQKSIPVFLSALTIELYSRQSIENSSSYPSVLGTPN